MSKILHPGVAALVAVGSVFVGSSPTALANGVTCGFTINGEPAQEVNIAIPPGLFEGLPDDLNLPDDLGALFDYLTPFASELDPETISLEVSSTLVDPFTTARIVYGGGRKLLAQESGSGLVPVGIDLPSILFFFGVIQYVLDVVDDPIGFLRNTANQPYRIEYDVLEGEGGAVKCSLDFILGQVSSGGFGFDGFRHYLESSEESASPGTDSALPETV